MEEFNSSETDEIAGVEKDQDISENMPENISTVPFEEVFESVKDFESELDHPMKLLFGDLSQRIDNFNNYVSSIKDPNLRKKMLNGAAILSLALGSVGCTARSSNQNPEIDSPTPITQPIGTDMDTNDNPEVVVTEDYTDEDNKPNSVESGLNAEGYLTHENESESLEPILTKEIVDALNIENWSNYELEKVEDIIPTSYLPNPVSTFYYAGDQFEGLFNTSLFVIPISKKDKNINLNSPVLEYTLKPYIFQSFSIDKKFTIRTPNNIVLTFGGCKGQSGDLNDTYLLLLMGISTEDGKNFEFVSVEESLEETRSMQNGLWMSHGHFDLNFSQNSYDHLLNEYNPESDDLNDKMILHENDGGNYFRGNIHMGVVHSVEEIENFLSIIESLIKASMYKN